MSNHDLPTEQELSDFFYEWFLDSYPRITPSSRTVQSHVAFAQEALKQFAPLDTDSSPDYDDKA
jgi:hypothetical protein